MNCLIDPVLVEIGQVGLRDAAAPWAAASGDTVEADRQAVRSAAVLAVSEPEAAPYRNSVVVGPAAAAAARRAVHHRGTVRVFHVADIPGWLSSDPGVHHISGSA
jgi:hypothetical protein